jgi:hypothetical protein
MTRARAWEILRPLLTALRVGLLAAGAIFAVSGHSTTGVPASAAPATAGPVAVTVLPTVGLTDGQTVAIHAEAPAGTVIYEIAAKICQPLVRVSNEVDFGLAGRYCWGPTAASPGARLGSADAIQTVAFPAGVAAGDLNTFKVGTGTVQWIDERGFPHGYTCGPGKPCSLVVRVQITGSTEFATIPICYGSDCPAEPQPPAAAPPAADPGAAAATTPAAGGKKAKGSKAGGTAADAPAAADSAATTTTTTAVVENRDTEPISVSRDSSRGTRVFVAGCVGALGGARLVQISNRARRRKSGSSA